MENTNVPVISAKDLNLWYGDFKALKSISLDVGEREITALIGPSGCGKSTLLRTFNRMCDFVESVRTEGAIEFGGQDIFQMDSNALRVYVGMVFQQFNLYPHLNVLGNLTLAPIKLFNKSRKEAEELAYHYLEVVGLSEKAHVYPTTLSGGQQQRVAIARAMVNDPALILADEPTGALDSETSRVVMDLFHEMHEKYHKTIVLITHNPALAEECQRVLTLHDGRIIAERKGSGVRGAL